MSSTALLGVQVLLATTALGCLCLSQERHARRVGPALPSAATLTRRRWSGWTLVTALLLFELNRADWGQGLVEACGALSLAALLVASLATWNPRWLPAISALSLGIALCIGISGTWQ